MIWGEAHRKGIEDTMRPKKHQHGRIEACARKHIVSFVLQADAKHPHLQICAQFN